MKRLVVVGLLLVVPVFLFAADPPSVQVARGLIRSVEKDVLKFQPIGEGGKFEKVIELKLTDATRLSTYSQKTKGGKSVIDQKDVKADSLTKNQTAAVVYIALGEDNIALSVTVQPAAEKPAEKKDEKKEEKKEEKAKDK
jgi:hypothetical protein